MLAGCPDFLIGKWKDHHRELQPFGLVDGHDPDSIDALRDDHGGFPAILLPPFQEFRDTAPPRGQEMLHRVLKETEIAVLLLIQSEVKDEILGKSQQFHGVQ